jgi:hypothetical protein
LIILPEGLGGLLYEIRDRILRVVAFRRGISVPGVVNEISRPAEADPGAVAVLTELATGDGMATTTATATKGGP